MNYLLLSLFVCTQAFAPSPLVRGGQGPSGEQATITAAQALEIGDKLWALQETIENTVIDMFHEKPGFEVVLAGATNNIISKELLKIIARYSDHRPGLMPALSTLLPAAYYKAIALPGAVSSVASIPQWQKVVMPRLRGMSVQPEKPTADVIQLFECTGFLAAPTSTQPMRMECYYEHCPGYVDFVAPWMRPQNYHQSGQHRRKDRAVFRRKGLFGIYGKEPLPVAKDLHDYVLYHFHLHLWLTKENDTNPLHQSMACWLYELMQNAYPFKSWYRQILVKATGCSNPTATQASLGGAPKTGSAAL